MSLNLTNLLPDVIQLARQAAAAILTIYQDKQAWKISQKADKTPITQADLVSHEILTKGLSTLTPDYPILSEESREISFEERSQWTRYWLIDPLDGTKEFIHQTDEFSISIAFIQEHQPILGIIYAPVTQRCAYALKGMGAFELTPQGEKRALKISEQPHDPLVIAMSRFHGEKFLSLLPENKPYDILHCGSALKFILIAAGEADFYPRFGHTSEWDTAAGQCIVEMAGGKVVDFAGNPLQYNAKRSLINTSFIATGSNYLDLRLLD